MNQIATISKLLTSELTLLRAHFPRRPHPLKSKFFFPKAFKLGSQPRRQSDRAGSGSNAGGLTAGDSAAEGKGQTPCDDGAPPHGEAGCGAEQNRAAGIEFKHIFRSEHGREASRAHFLHKNDR